jgi:hypothetical protein
VRDPDGRLASDLSLAVVGIVDARERRAGDPGRVAERERVRPPSMTRMIASLCELRLVVRAAHPVDGRRAGQEWLRQRRARPDSEQHKTLLMAADLMSAMVDESA